MSMKITVNDMFYQDQNLRVDGGVLKNMRIDYRRIPFIQFKNRMIKLQKRQDLQIGSMGMQPLMWNDLYLIRHVPSNTYLLIFPVFSLWEPRSILSLYANGVMPVFDKAGKLNTKKSKKNPGIILNNPQAYQFFQSVINYLFTGNWGS